MDSAPTSIAAILIPAGLLGGLLLYPVLQYLAWRTMRGIWRFFALLPLPLMGCVLAVTIIGLVQASNLWPIFLIFTAPIVLIYFGLLYLAYFLIKRFRSGPPPS